MIKFLNSCVHVAFTCLALSAMFGIIASTQFPDNRVVNGYTKELNPCTLGNLTTQELKDGTCWNRLAE